MRISDWSSDVCSSDLEGERHAIILTDERAGIDADIESFGKRHQEPDRRGHAHGHRRRTVDRQAGGTALPKPAAVIVEVEPDFVPSRRQRIGPRSEEHTSELQSLMRISYAVFCLKKKNNDKKNVTQKTHT